MSDLPPPHPSGYQPGAGEGLEFIDVTVAPSWGYQGVTVTGRYRFDSPRSLTEAQPVVDDLFAELGKDAAAKVDVLVGVRAQREAAIATAGVKAKAEKAAAPRPEGLVSGPRQGGGILQYLPEHAMPKRELEDLAKAIVAEEGGFAEAELIAFDNRERLGKNQPQASPVVVLAKRDTPLHLAMPEGKDKVALVGFTKEGSLAAKITDEAKAALIERTEVPTNPVDTDVPF